MARKKRKTLPKNFEEMLEAGEMQALKGVYDDCELNAYGGYDRDTALHFYNVPDELVVWLVEQGLDINTPSYTYKRTPLHEHATVGSDTVKLLLDLGADIEAPDKYGNTPLHAAAGFHRTDTVRLLVERGANVNAQGQTPLESALERCRNTDIANTATVAQILIDAGAEITPDMAESVRRIGKEFEFHRENFNKEYLAETDAGLSRLYSLFGVEPAAKRKTYDGVSPIGVSAADWQEQHQELWELLIPSQGPAGTVQGEVIRITGRVSIEIQGNGGANWNADYRKMLDALLKHLASGASLSEEELAEAKDLASSIRAQGDCDFDVTDRLCELAVKWVLANPQPAALGKTDYKR